MNVNNLFQWNLKPGRSGASSGKQTPDGDSRKCEEKRQSEGIPPKYN